MWYWSYCPWFLSVQWLSIWSHWELASITGTQIGYSSLTTFYWYTIEALMETRSTMHGNFWDYGHEWTIQCSVYHNSSTRAKMGCVDHSPYDSAGHHFCLVITHWLLYPFMMFVPCVRASHSTFLSFPCVCFNQILQTLFWRPIFSRAMLNRMYMCTVCAWSTIHDDL